MGSERPAFEIDRCSPEKDSRATIVDGRGLDESLDESLDDARRERLYGFTARDSLPRIPARFADYAARIIPLRFFQRLDRVLDGSRYTSPRESRGAL